MNNDREILNMDKIHTWFEYINTNDVKPSSLFKQILNEQGLSLHTSLANAGLNIAFEADKDSKEKASYHNYIHTAEAMASMYEMAKIEFENVSDETLKLAGVSSKNELIVLAVATMAGHDLYHDGKDKALVNPTTDLEAKSAHASRKLADSNNLDYKAAELIKYSIQATQVDESISNKNIENYKRAPNNPIYAIAQMATEADLAGSISSKFGVQKGLMLSDEVRKAGNENMALGLASFNGRKFFLESLCKIHSKGGLASGLESERLAQVISMNLTQETFSPALKELRQSQAALSSKAVSDLLGEDPCHASLKQKTNDAITAECRAIQTNIGTEKLLARAHDIYISTYHPSNKKPDLDFSL